MNRWSAIAVEMHKNVALWYAYLVTISVTLQEEWASFSDYVPVKARHWVIGVATVLVVANKALKAAKAVQQKTDA